MFVSALHGGLNPATILSSVVATDRLALRAALGSGPLPLSRALRLYRSSGPMPRAEGFAVMDVSTSVCDDPKFRRLQRENPELVAVAFTAYLATMAESWKAGRRVSADEAWPALIPFEKSVIDALIRVTLLDRRGLLASKAWRSWYEPARKRRDQSRDRWARYNAKRDADTTPPPRGNDVGTATSDPSVPSVRSSRSVLPSAPSTAARGEKNGQMTEEERRRIALLALSERFQRREIDELTYERERRALAS